MIANLPVFGLVFLSGTNHPSEIRGTFLAGRQVGVSVCELTEASEAELARQSRVVGQALFVDSGAFGEMAFDSVAGCLRAVKPISHDEWELRLDVYDRLARWWGARGYFVAPDCVGDQVETLRRLTTYRATVRRLLDTHGANVIVPLQRGALSLGEFMLEALRVIGYSPGIVWGIPSKKEATSLFELARFARDLEACEYPAPRVHLLGCAPKRPAGHPGQRFLRRYLAVKHFCPEAMVSSDSVRILALVGRTNGKGGASRALTAAQDEARRAGVLDPSERKAVALERVLGAEVQAVADLDALIARRLPELDRVDLGPPPMPTLLDLMGWTPTARKGAA